MCKHEEKYCPRCRAAFECRVGDVAQCQCSGIGMSEEARQFIAGRYPDCLCRNCLMELKKPDVLFKEKYFLNAGR
ncbi:MAG TPA: cysteine-rich CWC family protein [Puia sp.]|jgi:hypothetical protein